MTKINFKHDGFGIHSATIDGYVYNISPVAYDRNGKPKYGYTAVRYAKVTRSNMPIFATIASGSFATCRAACKIDAQNIAQEIAA